jgi:alpha-L-fucosidase
MLESGSDRERHQRQACLENPAPPDPTSVSSGYTEGNMKNRLALVLSLLLLSCLTAAAANENAPRPATDPATAKLAKDFLSWRFGLFLHFNMGTYVQQEWALGYEDPALFNPTKLDCGQWADAAKAAGMKYAVLTVKHTDGYCLWPSQHTNHGVQSFKNYKNGEGDIVREFVDAFRARGLKIGLYYCFPRDYTNRKGLSGPLPEGKANLFGLPPEAAGDFHGFIKKQMTELLTTYGPIDLMWCDQYQYMLTREQWHDIKAHIKTLQPNCLVLGNNAKNLIDSDLLSGEVPVMRKPFPPDNNTTPGEVNDILDKRGWFWKGVPAPEHLKSAREVVDKLKSLNQRHCNFLLNVAPNTEGLLDPLYVERLKEIGQLLASEEQKP